MFAAINVTVAIIIKEYVSTRIGILIAFSGEGK